MKDRKTLRSKLRETALQRIHIENIIKLVFLGLITFILQCESGRGEKKSVFFSKNFNKVFIRVKVQYLNINGIYLFTCLIAGFSNV